ILRIGLSYALLALAVALLGYALYLALELPPAFEKMTRTGDGAGFSLTLSFLVFFLLPLGASALIGALLVTPPQRRPRNRVLLGGLWWSALLIGLLPAVAVVVVGLIRRGGADGPAVLMLPAILLLAILLLGRRSFDLGRGDHATGR
ncbi:MAG: hypothetical protein AAB284_08260, partial [Chloroflexota bacterium]